MKCLACPCYPVNLHLMQVLMFCVPLLFLTYLCNLRLFDLHCRSVLFAFLSYMPLYVIYLHVLLPFVSFCFACVFTIYAFVPCMPSCLICFNAIVVPCLAYVFSCLTCLICPTCLIYFVGCRCRSVFFIFLLRVSLSFPHYYPQYQPWYPLCI